MKEIELQLTSEREALHVVEKALKQSIKGSTAPAEVTLSYRSCQMAMMWLGKAKGSLGIKSPYPESANPASTVIEPRADVGEGEIILLDDEVANVKLLRAELKKLEGRIANDCLIMLEHKTYQNAVWNAYTNCCNATMWLGMVLNAIRDTDKPKKKVKEDKSVMQSITGIIGNLTGTEKKDEHNDIGESKNS
jgi:hypothetical protein